MSEELNLEQIARDVETLRYEGAAIDAEEKRMGLNYLPESPASGGYVFRGIAARYVELAQRLRAALGRRGAQEEEPPHWLLKKLRFALDEARKTISVDHSVRLHVEAAMLDIDFYETATAQEPTARELDLEDFATRKRRPHELRHCRFHGKS